MAKVQPKKAAKPVKQESSSVDSSDDTSSDEKYAGPLKKPSVTGAQKKKRMILRALKVTQKVTLRMRRIFIPLLPRRKAATMMRMTVLRKALMMSLNKLNRKRKEFFKEVAEIVYVRGLATHEEDGTLRGFGHV
ncbi:hypothetical protein GUJ93_ZPchr0013g35084 [Zizania palustris]|uniref:Uncharacterized protein n=1 Tax=Zizania palustris TaxID=103762 RepID=A0A8J5WUR0_ZIZPA|nr:hypothetical protein GUJ93_ZPchr0013g35084 [Zizania palustris]